MNSCLVLAAGEGSRMNIDGPKVLAKVLGVPMLSWVIDSVMECKIENLCVVTGYERQKIIEFLEFNNYTCETVFQKERKGTAHAVCVASSFIRKNIDNDILILNGDSPFIDSFTMNSAFDYHKKCENHITIISAKVDNPSGYGRIVRDSDGNVCSIVEERDSSKEQKKILEINSGAYWFSAKELMNTVGSVCASKVSGEFYLTSVISMFIQNGLKVGAYCSPDCTVALGANTMFQLKSLNLIAKAKLIKKFMSQGIKIPYVDSLTIGKSVEIGEGTTILSDVTIDPYTKIGKNCVIGPKAVLNGGKIPDNTNLMFSGS